GGAHGPGACRRPRQPARRRVVVAGRHRSRTQRRWTGSGRAATAPHVDPQHRAGPRTAGRFTHRRHATRGRRAVPTRWRPAAPAEGGRPHDVLLRGASALSPPPGDITHLPWYAFTYDVRERPFDQARSSYVAPGSP